MTLKAINSQFGSGGTGLSDGTLRDALLQVQRQKVMVVTGGAAEADLTATGLTSADHLVSVVMFAAGVPSDVTAEASITEDDVLQLSTTNSTGNKLVVTYFAGA